MDRTPQLEIVLTTIRTHAEELRRRGVRRIAVFGSVARGNAGQNSDIDVLIDLDRQHVPSAWEYVGIGMELEAWLGRPVHLAVRENLRPYIRPEAKRDAVYAF